MTDIVSHNFESREMQTPHRWCTIQMHKFLHRCVQIASNNDVKKCVARLGKTSFGTWIVLQINTIYTQFPGQHEPSHIWSQRYDGADCLGPSTLFFGCLWEEPRVFRLRVRLSGVTLRRNMIYGKRNLNSVWCSHLFDSRISNVWLIRQFVKR